MRQYARYFKHLPLRNAVVFCFDTMFHRTRVVDTNIRGTHIKLRTNTPDFVLAVGSIVSDEYGPIQIKSPQFIVDGGANIGTSTLAFVKKFPDAKVFAIEIESENLQMLDANVGHLENVVIVRAGLAARNEKRAIHDRATGPWGYTIADTHNTISDTGQVVNCLTIDTLMREYDLPRIDLLKLDIEGAEKELFDAGGKWLAKTNVIVAELHDRISKGCSRSFYLATRDFHEFDKYGEKVVAYKRCPTSG